MKDALPFCHLEHTDASSVGLSKHSEMLSFAPKATEAFCVISTVALRRARHCASSPVGGAAATSAAVKPLEGAAGASGRESSPRGGGAAEESAVATRAIAPAVARLAAIGLYATLSRRIERGGGGGALQRGFSSLKIDATSPRRDDGAETPRARGGGSAAGSAVGSAVGTPRESPRVGQPVTPASYRHGPAQGCTSVFAGLSRLFGPTAAVGALGAVDFARLCERERVVRGENGAALASSPSHDGFVLVDAHGAMPSPPPSIERSPLRRVSNAMRALAPDSAATPRRDRRSSMTRARHFVAALKSPSLPPP